MRTLFSLLNQNFFELDDFSCKRIPLSLQLPNILRICELNGINYIFTKVHVLFHIAKIHTLHCAEHKVQETVSRLNNGSLQFACSEKNTERMRNEFNINFLCHNIR